MRLQSPGGGTTRPATKYFGDSKCDFGDMEGALRVTEAQKRDL